MNSADNASADTEILKSLSTVIEQILRWSDSRRAPELPNVHKVENPARYVVELVDVRTRSLINEDCSLESHLPLPLPVVGEIVGGPETEPYRVVKRSFKYRVKDGNLESHVVLYCVNLRDDDDAKLFG